MTAGHVAAEATVTYRQSCCVGDALLMQSTFVGANGATIDDFVDLYVTIDNGSVPVWPTSTYLIANGMRFEYWNDSVYYYIQYTPGSVAANYADQPGASIFSLGIDHPSGQPTGDHAVTLRGYAVGCVDPALPPPSPLLPSRPPPSAPSPSPRTPPPVNDVALRVSLIFIVPVVVLIAVLLCAMALYRRCYGPRSAEARRLAAEEIALRDGPPSTTPEGILVVEGGPVVSAGFRFVL